MDIKISDFYIHEIFCNLRKENEMKQYKIPIERDTFNKIEKSITQFKKMFNKFQKSRK